MPHLKLVCDHMMSIMTPPSTSVDGVLRHFAERTTMHGVPRIINAHSLPARIFWALICIGAFGMFFWQTAILMNRYYKYPKKVNMEIIQKPVPFPSVTVCNTDHLDLQIVDLLEKFLQYQNTSPITDKSDLLKQFELSYNGFYDDALAFLTVDLMTMRNRGQAMQDTLEVNSRVGMTANLGKDMASEAGVKLHDFIVSCQFMTYQCPVNNSFLKVFDPYYYNCFTFEPEHLVPTRNTRLQGVEYGLSLLLFSGSAGQFVINETEEFMYIIPGLMESNSALSSGRGARVVIHSPFTRPHPTYDGFDIAPGFSVTIGVKGRENVRIGDPHGNCTEVTPELRDEQGFNYTLINCQNECIQRKIQKACKCQDSRLPDLLDVPSNSSKYCLKLPKIDDSCMMVSINGSMNATCYDTINQWKETFKCRKEMYENITIKNPNALDDCGCYPPCEDMVFDTSYSLSKLPDFDSSEASAYSVELDKFFSQTLSEDKRQLLKNKYGENYTDTVIHHVSRLNVHIADSNIIKTTEQPDYEAIRLVSDIGGQLGLWIGISVITLFEVLQLIVDLFHFITSKGRSSVTERKSNGRTTFESSPSKTSHKEAYNSNTGNDFGMRYWDHRYSIKDCKPETRYECEKLTTV